MAVLKQVLWVGAGTELDLTALPKTFNGIEIEGRVVTFIQPLGTSVVIQARLKGNTTGLKQDCAIGGIYNKTNRAFDVTIMQSRLGNWDKIYVQTGEIEVHLEA